MVCAKKRKGRSQSNRGRDRCSFSPQSVVWRAFHQLSRIRAKNIGIGILIILVDEHFFLEEIQLAWLLVDVAVCAAPVKKSIPFFFECRNGDTIRWEVF